MSKISLKRLALGAAAGFVGTMAIQAVMTASSRVMPQAAPPINRDPGEFMLEQVEGLMPEGAAEKVPEKVEAVASKSLAMGYGLTFGVVYALLRKDPEHIWTDGLMLGLVVWAVGYLGWLPATGLMPPIWKQRPLQVASPLATHAVYGMATTAAYDLMQEHL